MNPRKICMSSGIMNPTYLLPFYFDPAPLARCFGFLSLHLWVYEITRTSYLSFKLLSIHLSISLSLSHWLFDSRLTMDDSPEHGHLGGSWEIAIVVVFVCLAAALVAAFVFQARRKRKEKRQRLEQQEMDAEKGQRTTLKDSKIQGKSRAKRPSSARSSHSEKRGDSASSRGTFVEKSKSDVVVRAAGSIEGSEHLPKVRYRFFPSTRPPFSLVSIRFPRPTFSLFSYILITSDSSHDNSLTCFVEQPPSPTHSTRHSKSSYHEYIANHPPKYYWDQR
ncbi:hypothetical protein D9756_001203 [Leucocoprinus leucothites]|uniref:Uncharacterized protein n=1 Tax=Leucocoprinus leucothites TaxID=201217 RepID=A0A8H5G431_9AGAR|nr:hypothetical protein D9756_001203 [Leucoagaricus leucothites]